MSNRTGTDKSYSCIIFSLILICCEIHFLLLQYLHFVYSYILKFIYFNFNNQIMVVVSEFTFNIYFLYYQLYSILRMALSFCCFHEPAAMNGCESATFP